MKVLKFGGKSLSNGVPLKNAINIIRDEHKNGQIAVVVSALADSTDRLLRLYDLALSAKNYDTELNEFIDLQNNKVYDLNLEKEFSDMSDKLEAVVQSENKERIKGEILAFGELISSKIVAHLLQQEGLSSESIDARQLLKVKANGAPIVNNAQSEALTKDFFATVTQEHVPVITGFIASDEENNTVTLGRNGTNFTASLIANYTDAEEVQNWTDVNGIYTASPKYVPDAQKISHLSFKEAHELANFGARILHPKTITPLMEKEIPLKIFNSFNREDKGTVVDKQGGAKGIKAVSVIEDVALITIEGKGLVGEVGIDARIFRVLSELDISIRLISQASSERGIGFVVDESSASLALTALNKEFKEELENRSISSIKSNTDMAIIAIVGRHNYSLEKAIYGLRRNKIWLHLISNSISGEHISLVIDNKDLKKAVNVVHSQVFGAIKTINLFALGKGTVGGKLIDQIMHTPEEVVKRRNLKIKVVGVADSERAVFNDAGLSSDWREILAESKSSNSVYEIVKQLQDSALENIVIADNTSSQEITNQYLTFLKAGFDLAASNKKANSGPIQEYQEIRDTLKRKGRLFFYETNVGAGLPIIDTLKHLHDSADKVTKVRGVFSGSLSYIFNNFSERDEYFSDILLEAKDKGFTEPDPREDLNGLDVARKLIILAREVGLSSELEDIELQNLIPESLRSDEDYGSFIAKKDQLDEYFKSIKEDMKSDEVLRYVGELDTINETLKVSLVKASKDSPLGNIKNADAIFEIYTEGYGEQPIVIQGAGAGGEVTARGVYSDLLRIGNNY